MSACEICIANGGVDRCQQAFDAAMSRRPFTGNEGCGKGFQRGRKALEARDAERRNRPCVELGAALAPHMQPRGCSCKHKLRACGFHGGACRVEPGATDGVRTCLDCDDYQAPPGDVEPPKCPSDSPGPLRVLFASHDLTRTGAPRILLHTIPHVRGIEPTLYSPIDGPLRHEFEQLGIPVVFSIDWDAVDLLFAQTIVSSPTVAEAKRLGVPIVWDIQEAGPEWTANPGEVLELLPFAKRLIFPNSASAKAFRADASPRTRIIPDLVPPAPIRDRDQARRRLGIADEEFVVVCVGSIEPRKGQRDLCAAVRNLPVTVMLVGDLSDPREIAGAPANVLHVPSTSDPWTYYACADVAVSCSRSETFGLNLVEAKQYRLPLIATPTNGAAELIEEGVHGFHYFPGDIAGLRNLILELMASPADRRRMGETPLPLPPFSDYLRDVERAISDAAGRTPSKDLLRVVYHACGWGGTGHWQAIVAEQLEQFAACGLTSIFLTHVGEGLDWIVREAARAGVELTIASHHDDRTVWEDPAIRLIELLAKTSDLPILYCHTKGVSRPLSAWDYHMWRRLMMRETVARWREHVETLDRFDAVGVNFATYTGRPHFSGNFWVASAKYLRRLPLFDAWNHPRDRWAPENWIGAGRGNMRSLLCRDKKFWIENGPQDSGLLRKLWEEKP